MKNLTRSECPNTRTAFISKWESDNLFRSRAKQTGFNVVMGNVIFPNGKVATPKVR